MAEKEHKFGDCAFGGAVVATDNACLEKFQTGLVTSHFNDATLALGNIYNNDTALGSIFELLDEPLLLRGITGTEGFEYDCFQAGDVKN